MTSSTPTQDRNVSDLPARAQESAAARRVRVAAAKLRVVLDDRLGRTTPPDVKKLAQEDF